MKVAVTGGAGYIGSHTCLELIKENYEVLIIDDLSNGNEIALNRIKQIAGANFVFKQVDIGNLDKLTEIFQKFLPESVIHFAGVKSVSESISNPTKY